ncbi:membrane protein insertion efficiency factor YidD [Corynebacterium uterequi]|uniref:Putative membrane protein insertion efficiency factor n=1 Tax=Corynebacterium uterequi TaxID=1072256 RepID=A0A0G3HFX2_9CORY|nr:membrane protein insertion efficiency factor YidD [Corynebacterium uterequi]AKK12194.1 putative membrane protein insertion efficiency factor [Corynebacterium uterequi]
MRNVDGEQLPQPRGLPARVGVRAVRFYQRHLSGLKPAATCRFVPTCSAYTLEAITRYGLFRGSLMGMIRLAQCGPWHPGGYDPVPERSLTD